MKTLCEHHPSRFLNACLSTIDQIGTSLKHELNQNVIADIFCSHRLTKSEHLWRRVWNVFVFIINQVEHHRSRLLHVSVLTIKQIQTSPKDLCYCNQVMRCVKTRPANGWTHSLRIECMLMPKRLGRLWMSNSSPPVPSPVTNPCLVRKRSSFWQTTFRLASSYASFSVVHN